MFGLHRPSIQTSSAIVGVGTDDAGDADLRIGNSARGLYK